MGLVNSVISARVRSVQGSAAGFSGSCTFAFSQMTNPVADIIGGEAATKAGICEMLSARWIIENAHGRSLKAWIAPGGGQGIDASKIRLLMQLFTIGTTMKPQQMVEDSHTKNFSMAGFSRNSTSDQDSATKNYLLSQGMAHIPVTGASWGKGDSSGGSKIKHLIARDLCDIRGGGPSWRVIGIWGTLGGHAMAFANGAAGCAFFDPNYGEFTFAAKDKFREWFTSAFYPMAFYTTMLGKRYELQDYKKKG